MATLLLVPGAGSPGFTGVRRRREQPPDAADALHVRNEYDNKFVHESVRCENHIWSSTTAGVHTATEINAHFP